jgi:thioredoxin reductase (NADPH)
MAAAASSVAVDSTASHGYDYDLVVIGGGSGGLACSKEAASLGKKVAVLDFVTPSPLGTTWGLGGTCVNVGCIPKKLMHQAALIGEAIEDAPHFGWGVDKAAVKHDWSKLVTGVQEYIGSLNWNYRVQLRSKQVCGALLTRDLRMSLTSALQVEYLNMYGEFVDPHTIKVTKKNGDSKTITAQHIVIATGGRPKYPDIPGAKEHGISSDDLFSLATPPGKTLVVGASYVALECAGFLHALGYETTVMARSIFLRGFDQEIAERIAAYMADIGTKFIRPAVPSRLEKLESGRIRVTYNVSGDSPGEHVDEFDTVLFAVGRDPCTNRIGIEHAGLHVHRDSGKFDVQHEQTNVPHIFAIGDIVHGKPELTPVAIQAGRLLARRLYAGSDVQVDYNLIPTTVFTPLEYGACGISEEAAEMFLGAENVEVYHTSFWPLEYTVAHRPENVCFAKIICDKTQRERIVGLHILGPHAGEVTQGFAAAMRLGATKADFDATIGIHPTVAEVFTTLEITKASGKDAKASGC